ncbi:MAG: DNA ligase D [Myxococcota bacterium]|nr:DNA ligase D [Myxococcota bacterium]
MNAVQRSIEKLALGYQDVQLATLAAEPPAGPGWSYELKFDGYRILALKADAEVRLVSRNHQDWTDEFTSVAAAVSRLGAKDCALDGEICALDAQGRPSFQLLQNRAAAGTRLVYFVFDVLSLNGADFRRERWDLRRARLTALLRGADRKRGVILSTAAAADPNAVLKLACSAGLEGIVAKAIHAPYVAGRTKTWLKIKCTKRQEFAVVGWLPLLKSRPAVGSLVLALMQPDGAFHFAGKVGTGLSEKDRRSLFSLLNEDRVSSPVALGVPRFGGLVQFVRPRHVAEVAFTEWTAAGHVRHPSFAGLRSDKSPAECVREQPLRAAVSAPLPRPALRAVSAGDRRRVEIAGISVSHPDRILDPAGVTKAELARYYESVGEWMLPHVKGRPLTLLRWAEGKRTEKGGIYLRHAKAWGPSALRRIAIQEKTKTGEYLVIDDARALVALAQMDILEIHTWNSVAEDLERPNRVVFDIDPAPDVPYNDVVRTALEVRERLAHKGLDSWVKTTGGKGLHVVVPLRPRDGWETCFDFTRRLALAMAADSPRRYIATMSKKARKGLLFIDYLRNTRASTSVAAYSIRARQGAPASVPISWGEIEDPKLTALGMLEVAQRLAGRTADPWEGYWQSRQTLSRPRGRTP